MQKFKPCGGCKTKASCTKAGKCLGKEKAAKKQGLAGKMAAAPTGGKGY